MIFDFFIHPEHAKDFTSLNKETYSKYIEHIKQVYKKSEFPILVNGLIKKEFEQQFPLEKTIESASFCYHDTTIPFDKGEVSPSNWDKFINLIEKKQNYRIHGTFLGECTQGFGVQLFAYLFRNEHWHNWVNEYPLNEYSIQKKLIKKYERNGEFKNSNIKFGIVLASPYTKILKPSLFKILRKYGNITYQFIDDKTVIYDPKCITNQNQINNSIY